MAAFASSYIKTEGSQVTRSADAASMTGTNFSSWYRTDEGTVYARATTSSITTAPSIYTFVDSSGTNANTIYGNASATNHLVVRASGATVANLDGGTFTNDTSSNSCGVYKVNDFALSLDGGAIASDNAGAIPVVDRLFIGGNQTGAVSGNLTIKKLAYYPKRLTNAELQGLTTV
jgi:hypothetical protein